MSPAPISPDGRWWWDGARWQSRLVEGELDLFWFTGTPDWFGRIAITGLIGLIPIVGTINLLGWTLVATDMLRQRWKELPPAGFQYLERGVAPFVVSLAYGLAVVFVLASMIGAAIAVIVANPHQPAVPVFLVLVALLIGIGYWFVALYLFAAILVGADRLGVGRAIDPARLVALARHNQSLSVSVGVTFGVASIALAAISLPVGFIVPFGGLAVSVALPAIYAMVAPKLVAFRVETAQAAPGTQDKPIAP